MFNVENVRKVFSLLEDLEKEQYRFTTEEKQIFYRSAFHTDSFDAVQEMIFQTAMLESGIDKRQELLRQYTENLPVSPCDDAVQIEGYIFQLQHMCYEKEKAMKILEDILKKSGFDQEIDSRIGPFRKQPVEMKRRKEQTSDFMGNGEQQPKKDKIKESFHRKAQEGEHLANKNKAVKKENQRSR